MTGKLRDVPNFAGELQCRDDLVREQRAGDLSLLQEREHPRHRRESRRRPDIAKELADGIRGHAHHAAGSVAWPQDRFIAVENDAAGMTPHVEHMQLRKLLSRMGLVVFEES